MGAALWARRRAVVVLGVVLGAVLLEVEEPRRSPARSRGGADGSGHPDDGLPVGAPASGRRDGAAGLDDGGDGADGSGARAVPPDPSRCRSPSRRRSRSRCRCRSLSRSTPGWWACSRPGSASDDGGGGRGRRWWCRRPAEPVLPLPGRCAAAGSRCCPTAGEDPTPVRDAGDRWRSGRLPWRAVRRAGECRAAACARRVRRLAANGPGVGRASTATPWRPSRRRGHGRRGRRPGVGGKRLSRGRRRCRPAWASRCRPRRRCRAQTGSRQREPEFPLFPGRRGMHELLALVS